MNAPVVLQCKKVARLTSPRAGAKWLGQGVELLFIEVISSVLVQPPD